MPPPPPRRGPAVAWNVLAGVLMIAYPMLVYLGMTRWSSRTVALGLLCVLLPVAAVRMQHGGAGALRGLALIPLVTVAALVLGAVLDARGLLLVVPVAVNVLLLATFGSTLRRGSVPMIERFARLADPGLSPPKMRWCRAWTVVWCAFFLLNGATALVLALAASLSWWTLYTGLLAYVLMGLLFTAEWLGRRRRFGRSRRAARTP